MTIDRVFLGQYSTLSLGAAMAVMGVFWVPMALLQQTSAYSITFTAQYLGSKENHMIGPALWQSIYLSVIGGLLFLGLIPLADLIFGNFNHSPEMTHLEIQYFAAICFSALPTAIVAGISGFYTGLGKSQMVMWINGVGLVANVILDYLLIFGNWGFPEMGIVGAGYATAGANLCAALFAFVVAFSKEHDVLYKVWSGFKWNTQLMLRFLKFGLPSGLQWALEGLAFTVFLIFTGQFVNGDAALSASSIAVTIMMLAILPTLGIGQAVSALVGQHLGENKPELAEEKSWTGVQIAFCYILLAGISFILIPEFYTNWFKNEENIGQWNEVAEIVPYLLMFVSLFTLFDSLNIVLSFALKGAGDTRFVSIAALLVPWPLMVLPTYFVTHLPNAVYYSWAFASIFIITQAIIFFFRFRGGKWKSMRVT